MQPTPNSQELAQIMRFVQSPAGQQLLASLQQLNSNEINSAMADAAAGELRPSAENHLRVSRDPGGEKAAVPSGRRQMSEMEEKLGAILSNPQMMQQIMSMAQAMSPPPEPQGRPEQPPEPAPPALPDFSVMQKLAGMTRQSGIDKNQQALLRALSPYISRERSAKLEKAMRAAKMARLASVFLNAGGLDMLTGR